MSHEKKTILRSVSSCGLLPSLASPYIGDLSVVSYLGQLNITRYRNLHPTTKLTLMLKIASAIGSVLFIP